MGKRIGAMLVGCAIVAAASVALAIGANGATGVANGARDGAVTGRAVANVGISQRTNFDNIRVPAVFEETVSLHRLNGVSFKGGGAVVNEAGGFSISGYSPPNFLAFNCADDAATADPRFPRLPETISFGRLRRGVKLDVGSFTGTVLRVKGFGATRERHLVVLAAEMATVSFSIPVRTVTLSSADKSSPVCVLAVDDSRYTS